jgi:hypothetical protein
MRGSIALLILALGAALAVPGAALAKGPPQPSFYVDGTVYRTIGTPTDLEHTGAPAHSFDTIYAFPMGTQMNVATAAPGDDGYNGGRWQVRGLSFSNYASAAATYGGANGVFDTEGEVHAALTAGAATDLGIVKWFECPVIPVPGG